MKKWTTLYLAAFVIGAVLVLASCGAPNMIKPASDGGLPPCPTIGTITTTASVGEPSTDCYQPPYVPPSAPTTIPQLPDDCVAGTTRWSMQPCGPTTTTAVTTVVSEPYPQGTLPRTG